MSSERSQEAKNIHHHLATASKVTATIAIAAFIGVLLLGAWVFVEGNGNPTPSKVTPAVEPGVATSTDEQLSSEEITETYRNTLNSILSDFAFNDSAQAQERLNKILELRVPAELKTTHLEIVFALNDAQAGRYEEAQKRITTLKEQYAWMTF